MKMKLPRFFKKYYCLLIAVIVLWSVIAILLKMSLGHSQGHPVYSRDDPYIHMAMAKNLVTYGAWSINKSGFTSSSSSPLWVLILGAIYYSIGVNAVTPFVLNCCSATLVVILAYFWLKKYKLEDSEIAVALLSIVFFTHLAPLVLSGQEHVLHVLITLAFVYTVAEVGLVSEGNYSARLLMVALAAVETGLRYEGLFVVFGVSCLLLARRRFADALWCGVGGLLPVIIYGSISHSLGWPFVPNPVGLKGATPPLPGWDLVDWVIQRFLRVYTDGHLHIMILLPLATLVTLMGLARSSWNEPRHFVLMIFILSCLLHTLFARFGWLWRYEAYLVTLALVGLWSCSPLRTSRGLVRESWKVSKVRLAATAFLLLLASAPFLKQAELFLVHTPIAVKNIYQQQYQMGLFVRQYYSSQVVAVNDIGAVSYLGDAFCLDLFGLASKEVAEFKQKKLYDVYALRQLVSQYQPEIAIIYDEWFKKDGVSFIPEEWVKVGEWKMSDNVVCGSDVVCFYAIAPGAAEILAKNLKDFARRLPSGVEVTLLTM